MNTSDMSSAFWFHHHACNVCFFHRPCYHPMKPGRVARVLVGCHLISWKNTKPGAPSNKTPRLKKRRRRRTKQKPFKCKSSGPSLFSLRLHHPLTEEQAQVPQAICPSPASAQKRLAGIGLRGPSVCGTIHRIVWCLGFSSQKNT